MEKKMNEKLAKVGEGNTKLGLQHRAVSNAGLPLRDGKGTWQNCEKTLALEGGPVLGFGFIPPTPQDESSLVLLFLWNCETGSLFREGKVKYNAKTAPVWGSGQSLCRALDVSCTGGQGGTEQG